MRRNRRLQKNDLQVLLAEAKQNGLVVADLEAACLMLGVSPFKPLNRIAVEVAEGFFSD